MYAPTIKTARRVREHRLGPDHHAVLMTDVVQDPASAVSYAHLMVVFERGKKDPVAFISVEFSDPKAQAEALLEMGIEPEGRTEQDQPSCFLCAFVPSGHLNFGAVDRSMGLEAFEAAALDRIRRLRIVA